MLLIQFKLAHRDSDDDKISLMKCKFRGRSFSPDGKLKTGREYRWLRRDSGAQIQEPI